MALLYPLASLQRRLSAMRGPHDPPTAALPMVPTPINAMLLGLVSLENALARRFSFPFGVSIVCVASK
jgi:hypothetical protein